MAHEPQLQHDPTDPDPRAFLARREAAEAARVAAYLDSLRAALPALAQIVHAAGAQSVMVFGSLVDGTGHAESDIDLAVTGLPPDAYFKVLTRLLSASPVPVDLVELERAPASLRAHILATGQSLPRDAGEAVNDA